MIFTSFFEVAPFIIILRSNKLKTQISDVGRISEAPLNAPEDCSLLWSWRVGPHTPVNLHRPAGEAQENTAAPKTNNKNISKLHKPARKSGSESRQRGAPARVQPLPLPGCEAPTVGQWLELTSLCLLLPPLFAPHKPGNRRGVLVLSAYPVCGCRSVFWCDFCPPPPLVFCVVWAEVKWSCRESSSSTLDEQWGEYSGSNPSSSLCLAELTCRVFAHKGSDCFTVSHMSPARSFNFPPLQHFQSETSGVAVCWRFFFTPSLALFLSPPRPWLEINFDFKPLWINAYATKKPSPTWLPFFLLFSFFSTSCKGCRAGQMTKTQLCLKRTMSAPGFAALQCYCARFPQHNKTVFRAQVRGQAACV